MSTCFGKKSCSESSCWPGATVHVIVLQILNDIVIHELPLSATKRREANLDTFANKHSRVSSKYFISQGFAWNVLWADHVLGLGREADFLKTWKGWQRQLPHAARKVRLKGNIMSNLVVTDARVFVTTFVGTLRCNSRQNWQSLTRIASERWETDLVKEIRRNIKVVDFLSNLMIEINRIRFRCTHFSSRFQKGWDNATSSCKGTSATCMPWST